MINYSRTFLENIQKGNQNRAAMHLILSPTTTTTTTTTSHPHQASEPAHEPNSS